MFLINSSVQAGCLDKLRNLISRTAPEDVETDQGRRNFLRGSVAAIAVAAAPGGMARMATAAVADTVNRTELLRKAARLRNGVSINDAEDYAATLEEIASRTDFSGVGEILQRRATQLSDRLARGSDLFKNLPERILNEGNRPSLTEIRNSPQRLARIQRNLFNSRVRTLRNLNNDLMDARDQLIELILNSQQLQVDLLSENNLDAARILNAYDEYLIREWDQTLAALEGGTERRVHLYPELGQNIERYREEASVLLSIWED